MTHEHIGSRTGRDSTESSPVKPGALMVDREEQYVLRVQDKAVAARIRKQLNQEHSKAKLDVRLDGLCSNA